ncbi:unnamed protein product [Leptidea sinapis]|uniref:THAP-type domain-containing protein n=1 Tax=Leptidea sinapis TaxID=189913 RepID=A0A5E4QJY1_9NEOP|nr:unnamed protein product [Leptidea sinapis]
MARCAVKSCQNRLLKSRSVKLHRFPTNPQRYKIWIEAVGRSNLINGSKDLRLCTYHFLPSCYHKGKRGKSLLSNAVPTIFPLVSQRLMSVNMPENEEHHTPIQVEECRACLCILSPEQTRHNLFRYLDEQQSELALTAVAEDLIALTNIQINCTDQFATVVCVDCHDFVCKMKYFVSVVRQSNQTLRERYRIKSEPNEEFEWPKPIKVDKSSDVLDNVDIKEEVMSEDELQHDDNDQSVMLENSDIKIEPEEWSQTNVMEMNGLTQSHNTSNERATPEKQITTPSNDTSKMNGYSETGLLTKVKDEPVSDHEEILESLPSEMSLECILCSKEFISVNGLKAHVIAQHSYKSVRRKREDSITPEKRTLSHTCASCRRKFETATDLMVHETCHNKSVCYGCSESFDTFQQLTKHRSTCKAISSKEIAKVVKLQDVQRVQPISREQVFKCSLCSESFSDKYYLDIHHDITHAMNSEQRQCYANDYKDLMETDTLESLLEET